MKTYQFTVVIEPDEDAFHAFVPALPGCHTFGMTVDEARANIAEAMQLHIEGMQEDDDCSRSSRTNHPCWDTACHPARRGH